MYTTCIFCQGDLNRNEAIEEFPVGRRLAFDSAKGRLWVVCRRCERWNLSPLDERWEAIEACERAFEGTRMRVASDNIGLAKLKEGLELVRVGDPLRQEFAAWRYGDQFGRRRRRAILVAGAGAAATGALIAGGLATGIGMGSMWWPGQMIANWHRNRIVLRTRDEAGHPIRIQRKHLYTSRILPGEGVGGWDLHVHHRPGWKKKADGGRGSGRRRGTRRQTMIVSGDEAIGLAGQIMARANHWGGNRKTVRAAVGRIETAGHPDVFLPRAAAEAARSISLSSRKSFREMTPKRLEKVTSPLPGSLAGLKPDLRLAIEMATHEQAERAALEGELKELEARWREAEEIAHIADNLFVPERVESFIAEERRAVAAGRGTAAGAPARGDAD